MDNFAGFSSVSFSVASGSSLATASIVSSCSSSDPKIREIILPSSFLSELSAFSSSVLGGLSF